jgi:hypothetical protein
MAGDNSNSSDQPNTDKAERLAQALRANLRRRKAQSSARKSGKPKPNDRPETPTDDEGNT